MWLYPRLLPRRSSVFGHALLSLPRVIFEFKKKQFSSGDLRTVKAQVSLFRSHFDRRARARSLSEAVSVSETLTLHVKSKCHESSDS